MTTPLPSTLSRSNGRLFVWLGVVLTVLTIVVYVVQVFSARLTTPWYVPIGVTIGAVFIAVSLLQRRSVGRVIVLLLVVLLAGASWTFLVATRLPVYTGAVAVGKPFPAFSTMTAEGQRISEKDFAGMNSVLVFFRGRW